MPRVMEIEAVVFHAVKFVVPKPLNPKPLALPPRLILEPHMAF